jgi:hypothetical protein
VPTNPDKSRVYKELQALVETKKRRKTNMIKILFICHGNILTLIKNT